MIKIIIISPSNTFSVFLQYSFSISWTRCASPCCCTLLLLTGPPIRSSTTSLYSLFPHLMASTFPFPSFIDMSSGSTHHGKPAASLRHGPPSEPQRIWAAWHWKTPNSHQTSSYSYTCWNWGNVIVIWRPLRFEIMSILGTLLD